jgi:hypothetical protein
MFKWPANNAQKLQDLSVFWLVRVARRGEPVV